jgi:hypothetical protein
MSKVGAQDHVPSLVGAAAGTTVIDTFKLAPLQILR